MNAVLETKNMPQVAANLVIKSKLMAIVDYFARLEFLDQKLAAGPLSPEEQAEHAKLQANPVEIIDVINSQLPTWLNFLGDPANSAADRAAYRSGTVEAWMTANMPRIYGELVAHTNMTVEGLKALPAAPPQVVWRGDWQNAVWGYSVGSRIPIQVLRSFSKDEATGRSFMSDGKFSKKILLRVQTKADGAGRDIKALSKYATEDEILMMPGASLVVTRVVPAADHTVVHCDEA